MRLNPVAALVILSLFPRPSDADSRVCLPDDNQTCLVLSPAASEELNASGNPTQENIQIQITRNASAEVNRTLRAIQITATGSHGEIIPGFSFQNPVELTLGYWSLFQNSTSQNSAPGSPTPFSPVNDVRQWLTLYWNNGQSAVRLNGLQLDNTQSLSIPIHDLGSYQLIVAMPSSALSLAQGSPYPKIITPKAVNNRRAFFYVNAPGTDAITGTVYDFLGAKVRDLQVDSQSPAPNALVWDGKDMNGSVVPAGAYYYKISSSGQTITGSLVVAR